MLMNCGEVAKSGRNALDSKSSYGLIARTWVRIPPSPPFLLPKKFAKGRITSNSNVIRPFVIHTRYFQLQIIRRSNEPVEFFMPESGILAE